MQPLSGVKHVEFANNVAGPYEVYGGDECEVRRYRYPRANSGNSHTRSERDA